MSTVTTRLCQYGHTDCSEHPTPNKARTQAARQARTEAARQRHQKMIATIETMVAAGASTHAIVIEFGFGKVDSLQRTLYRIGRGDLARIFDETPKRRKSPYNCAIKGCRGNAFWIEDPAVDPDDEPIAEWSYLCVICQRREDMCEDLLFLLDPSRGGETDLYRVAGRLGYGYDYDGLEALRRALERYGRNDLRELLHVDLLKDQRGWSVQGTVRSDVAYPRHTTTDAVRAYERAYADPGMVLTGSMFR